MKKDIKRNRKNENLAGLYAIPNEVAYKNGKLRKGVFGAVDKNTPFVATTTNFGKDKPRKFVKDMSALPAACKNRILAFARTVNPFIRNVQADCGELNLFSRKSGCSPVFSASSSTNASW